MSTNRYVIFRSFFGQPLGPYEGREFGVGEIVELTGERQGSVRIRFDGRGYGVDPDIFFRAAKRPEISPNPQ